MQLFSILFVIISRNVKTHLQCKKKKKTCAVYREGAVTDQTCQKWFAQFCAGDCLLDIVPRLGRPAEVDSDQIETLVENNHRYTTQKIANILKIPKSLKLLVKMKKCVFYYMEKMKQTFFQPNKLKKVLSINFFSLFSFHLFCKVFYTYRFLFASFNYSS